MLEKVEQKSNNSEKENTEKGEFLKTHNIKGDSSLINRLLYKSG